MVLVLIGAIQNIPRDVEDAARVLGASWGSAFLRVTLPLSAPGILSGSILVFVLTISALVTPRLLGGPTYQVMSTLIYDEFLQRLELAGRLRAVAAAHGRWCWRWSTSRAASRGGRERARDGGRGCARGSCGRGWPWSSGS